MHQVATPHGSHYQAVAESNKLPAPFRTRLHAPKARSMVLSYFDVSSIIFSANSRSLSGASTLFTLIV